MRALNAWSTASEAPRVHIIMLDAEGRPKIFTPYSFARDVCTALKAFLLTLIAAELAARAVTSVHNAPPPQQQCRPLVARTMPEQQRSTPKKAANAALYGTVGSLNAALRVAANGQTSCRVEHTRMLGANVAVTICFGGSSRCSCHVLPNLAAQAALVSYPDRTRSRRDGRAAAMKSRGERGGGANANRTAVGVGAALGLDACERLGL